MEEGVGGEGRFAELCISPARSPLLHYYSGELPLPPALSRRERGPDPLSRARERARVRVLSGSMSLLFAINALPRVAAVQREAACFE